MPEMIPDAYSVSQVNHYIRNMFVQDFALSHIAVRGEISNLKYHTSGHIYFTLKDAASQISAIMFAGDRAGLPFKLEEGMQVIATGNINVYERGGSYQLYTRKITPDGVGELFLRYEQLKRELEEMGMFDPMYKKPIPLYATRVGIVTAKTGAAVRDIIQIARRRNPYVELVLYPAQVQGNGAAESVCAGIRQLDRMGLDVMIVGRGGGSIEDLWAFNEEIVARAIFNAETPVISAVGHETDVTIADFAADLRAPTPSAAAELAVFDYFAFMEALVQQQDLFLRCMKQKMAEARQKLETDRLRLSHKNPLTVLQLHRQRCAEQEDRMRFLIQDRLNQKKHRLALLTEKLEAASPLRKLESGFAYLTDMQGMRTDSIKKMHEQEKIRIYLKDGQAIARVEELIDGGKKETESE